MTVHGVRHSFTAEGGISVRPVFQFSKRRIMNPVNIRSYMEEAADVLSELVFTRRCPVCDQVLPFRSGNICPGCFSRLSFTRSPVCKKCGKEVIGETTEYCDDCARRRKSFEYGIALLNYDDTAKRSMAKIKYRGRREYMDFYGEAIAKRYERRIRRMEADVLIPVPVHRQRLRERGFNQAEALAESISRHLPWELPVRTDILLRNKKTLPQKDLSAAERLKNLSQAFEADERKIASGIRRVILTDDIYTTGSTAEACSRVLLAAGAEQVYLLNVCIGHGR